MDPTSIATTLLNQATHDAAERFSVVFSENAAKGPIALKHALVNDPVLSYSPDQAERALAEVRTTGPLGEMKVWGGKIRIIEPAPPTEKPSSPETAAPTPKETPPAPTVTAPPQPPPPGLDPDVAFRLASQRNQRTFDVNMRFTVLFSAVVLVAFVASLVAGLVLRENVASMVFGGLSVVGIGGIVVPIRKTREANAVADQLDYVQRRTADITRECERHTDVNARIACKQEAWDKAIALVGTLRTK